MGPSFVSNDWIPNYIPSDDNQFQVVLQAINQFECSSERKFSDCMALFNSIVCV
jgi:hypothetical protein